MYEYAGQLVVLGLVRANLGVDVASLVMLVDKVREQDADTSPKEGEETHPLLGDRPESVKALSKTRKAEKIPP